MKNAIIINILIFSIQSFSQNYWQTVFPPDEYRPKVEILYNDTINDVLYAAGNIMINSKADSIIILRYKNNVWDTLPAIFDATVKDMILFNGELYVAGGFTYIDTLKFCGIAKYTNDNFYFVGEGFCYNNENGGVGKLKIINDTLYAMGYFKGSGEKEINNIAKWNGVEWQNVYNFPDYGFASVVYDINIFNNEIFVGGNFHSDTLDDFIKYDGQNWVKPKLDVYGSLSAVSFIDIYKDKMFVGGNLCEEQGTYIAMYDGSKWFTDGFQPSLGVTLCSKEYNNELYIGGKFSDFGGMPAQYIVKWDGTQFCKLQGALDLGERVLDIEFYHDTLYTCSGNSINYYTGSYYSDTCFVWDNIDEKTIQKNSITIYPNPTNSTFNIKLNTKTPLEIEISIFSINGNQIFEKHFYQTNEIRINNLHLEKGVYFVELKTDEFVKTKKLIIN